MTGQAVPQALFECPAGRARDALARLRTGALWASFLPGMDPAVALAVLGDAGGDTLTLAIRCMPDPGPVLRAAGYPFAAPPAEVLAAAVIADGARAGQAAPVPSPVRQEFGPRGDWHDLVARCLGHAASPTPAEGCADPLDLLLMCPTGDLRSLVGIADADTRERFAAGLQHVEADPGLLADNYFLSSAAAGLMRAVAVSLESLPGGIVGRDEDGWPLWWEPGPGVPLSPANPASFPDAYAVLLTPGQAARMVSGWPSGMWLVAMRGRDEIDRWEAAPAEGLPDVLSGLPAWPPTGTFEVAEVGAPEEIRLVRRIVSQPGIAAAAAARAEPTRAALKEISAEDVDW